MKRKPAKRRAKPKLRRAPRKPGRAYPQQLGDAILAMALVAGVGSR